ncbi:uncharacterized protein yuxk [Phtheirospermum japonicum]|uniref:Uncharacterized protein yuxk n=1 Tax=Phtheirospermum japonicum TaxID=374723 RepID=A0A830CM64_9LAMI|nr:uncharacterized protein yuxk [Phtheirospermum japonicum]
MKAALRRAALTALTNRNTKWFAFSKPLTPRCYSSSAQTASSRRKCAADQVLLDVEAVSAVPLQVAMVADVLRPRVVVYDGVCHLCHAGVKWIIKADKDRKIKFCCLQSNAAEPYMSVSGLEREDVLRRFLFVEGPGSYHQGSAAALRVLSYLPLPYSALSALMIIPAPLRDAVYDYVAKRRYDWFGKEDDCLVLKETELLERFVDWEELLERSRQKDL